VYASALRITRYSALKCQYYNIALLLKEKVMKFPGWLLVAIAFVVGPGVADAQISFHSDNNTYRIVYESARARPGANRVVVYTNDRQTLITTEKDFTGDRNFPVELSVIDRSSGL